MIEVLRLLQQKHVFQQRRPARSRLQRVLVVCNDRAGLVGHGRVKLSGDLMQLVAGSGQVILGFVGCRVLVHDETPIGVVGSSEGVHVHRGTTQETKRVIR